MSFLKEYIYEQYKDSSNDLEKKGIYDKYMSLIWKNSSCKYNLKNKNFKYIVTISKDNEMARDMFLRYCNIEYKINESYKKFDGIGDIDYIKIHINNIYAYLFDKEVYYDKEYYICLGHAKKKYYQYIEGKIENPNIEEIENEIKEHLSKAERIKKESIDKKFNLTWAEFKKMTSIFLKRTLDNYKDQDYKQYTSYNIEEKHIVIYVCKSLDGYFRNYINSIQNKKFKRNLKEYISCDNIFNKYTPFQLTIGKHFNSCDELLEVKALNNNQLTTIQKTVIKSAEKLVEIKSEKDIIFFNDYKVPYINGMEIARQIDDSNHNVSKVIKMIYKKVDSNNIHLINCKKCGRSIIKKTNRKYCPQCSDIIKKEKVKERVKKYRCNAIKNIDKAS